MRRFRLYLILLIVGVVVASVAAALAFSRDEWRLGVPAALLAVAAAVGLYRLVGKMAGLMSVFVEALEMNDTTMRFDVGHDDPQLRRMSAAMNRIVELYRSNSVELETRKLYYDRILSVMTHEMRNAITPVVALTDDMTARPDKYSGDALNDALELIAEQTSGIKRFLDSYSRLTHLPSPSVAPIAASEFISNISDVMSIELQERRMDPETISYIVGADMTLNIDRDMMRQAVVNLLRNALDAVEGAGGEPHVALRVTMPEGAPFISIVDNGAGIEPRVMENLFQPFFTTKPEGSGIGLYLARQIVRLHGGDLHLSSAPGRGTTVAITLPSPDTKHIKKY